MKSLYFLLFLFSFASAWIPATHIRRSNLTEVPREGRFLNHYTSDCCETSCSNDWNANDYGDCCGCWASGDCTTCPSGYVCDSYSYFSGCSPEYNLVSEASIVSGVCLAIFFVVLAFIVCRNPRGMFINRHQYWMAVKNGHIIGSNLPPELHAAFAHQYVSLHSNSGSENCVHVVCGCLFSGVYALMCSWCVANNYVLQTKGAIRARFFQIVGQMMPGYTVYVDAKSNFLSQCCNEFYIGFDPVQNNQSYNPPTAGAYAPMPPASSYTPYPQPGYQQPAEQAPALYPAYQQETVAQQQQPQYPADQQYPGNQYQSYQQGQPYGGTNDQYHF